MKRSAANDEYENSPFRRYMSYEGDEEVRFAKQNDGSYKFLKLSMKKQEDSTKVDVIKYHGVVGTDGVEENVGEFPHMGLAARKMSSIRTALFLSESEEDQYRSYSEMQRQKEEDEKQANKKAKKDATDFPSISGKLVYPSSAKTKSKTNWVSLVQEFMPTYEYVQEEHRRFDVSSADPSEWTFYEAHDKEDVNSAAKKAHTALVKKIPFVKAMSKEYPGKIIQEAYNNSIQYKIFELAIDGEKYFLLTVCLCDNDAMGHYNVLYNKTKKEMFRIEVMDTLDPTVEEDGEWKTPAMKKKNNDLLTRIELFITSRTILEADGDFVFDWEEETCA